MKGCGISRRNHKPMCVSDCADLAIGYRNEAACGPGTANQGRVSTANAACPGVAASLTHSGQAARDHSARA